MKSSTVFLVVAITVLVIACHDHSPFVPRQDPGVRINENAQQMLAEGRATFRSDTFGSERFFGDALRLHDAIRGARLGGVGAGLSPRTALQLGLKIDADALSPQTIEALRNNQVDLDDPAVTLSLLQARAVVGLTGIFGGDGQLQSVGIQCALCHATVDDELMPSFGVVLDGWANRDLDVGKIIALAPTVQPIASLLQVDEATVRTALRAWGPGKFDAQLLLDGKAFRPDNQTAATLIPPAFGLAGVNLHTWTGAWGSVTYWNAFVANLEMNGSGTFLDARLNDPVKYPVAVRSRAYEVRNSPDRVTGKLAALHFYQLAIPSPTPPAGSFNAAAAARGKILFEGPAKCATCHVPPIYTEPGWNLHTADEIGIDGFQASRSPDNRYRTAPLKGLWSHAKGGFYHDGRFATLLDVVNHYDGFLRLGLAVEQKSDLVEFLKSL